MTRPPGDASPSIVYCLTSEQSNPYAEMAATSAYLLRRVQPSARIVLLMDQVTADQSYPGLNALRELVDESRAVRIEAPTRKMSSRVLKIGARRELQGDLLFVDADTLPIRPIADAFETPGDIAGVVDPAAHIHTDPPDPMPEVYRELDWQKISRSIYLNSGVLLMRDTPMMHQISEQWEYRYRKLAEAGYTTDQQPLAQTLHHLKPEVGRLPTRYNAMVLHRRHYFAVRHAAIIHIWATMSHQRTKNNAPKTVLDQSVAHLKDAGTFDEPLLTEFLRTGNPWAGPTLLPNAIALGWYGQAARRAAWLVGERLKRVQRS